MSVRIPNYVLTEAFSVKCGHETKTLPNGSFVKPIEFCYVPQHVIENREWKYFNKKTEMFCYTSLGIIAIPKGIIREV